MYNRDSFEIASNCKKLCDDTPKHKKAHLVKLSKIAVLEMNFFKKVLYPKLFIINCPKNIKKELWNENIKLKNILHLMNNEFHLFKKASCGRIVRNLHVMYVAPFLFKWSLQQSSRGKNSFWEVTTLVKKSQGLCFGFDQYRDLEQEQRGQLLSAQRKVRWRNDCSRMHFQIIKVMYEMAAVARSYSESSK